MDKAENPNIVNVCGTGMHGSRLIDLLGVAFAENNKAGKVKYVLYNPGAVQTAGAIGAYEQPIMKLI